MLQILNAVKHMHDVTIVHRDLKLDNICINDQMQLKIIDFGFSTLDDNQRKICAGTMSYLAPEIIE